MLLLFSYNIKETNFGSKHMIHPDSEVRLFCHRYSDEYYKVL